MSLEAQEQFDLVQFAQGIKSKLPSYEDLTGKVKPEFLQKLSSLRDEFQKIRLEQPHKRIFVVLGTGGTFQSADLGNGMLAPSGNLEESFRALGLPEDPQIYLKLFDLMNFDSSQMNVGHWRFLAEMIMELEMVASDLYDAVIITHGTDTMADAASYLSFMLRGFGKTIILTGSQYPARMIDTDAKDQMDRTLTTAKIATSVQRKIAEVMVCCGSRVTRGTWASKNGDTTVNVFGPWNQPRQDFDASDWGRAARDGTLHRLAPALLDFSTGKSRGSLVFADHAISVERKGVFSPFTQIEAPADIYPITMSDKSPVAFARHIIQQKVALLTQLGSATADDSLIDIALQAAERGKAAIFNAAFPDSSIRAGHYEAGKAMTSKIHLTHRPLPVINTSPAAMKAKVNFAVHFLNMQAKNIPGIGDTFAKEDLIRFNDFMEQNLVGELV